MFMAANGIPGSFGSFSPEQRRHKCANPWPLMAFYRQLDLGATNAIDSIGGLDLCFLGRPILETRALRPNRFTVGPHEKNQQWK